MFNKAQNAESLALCNNLLQEYPADPEKTPEILLLMSLNYDHIAYKSGKKEDELSAKAAAETVTVKYPDSRQAAEAYFYLGEVYSGHVPVQIETDCAKALPMYIKAIQQADKQWVKDESVKGIERCKPQSALPAPGDGAGRPQAAGRASAVSTQGGAPENSARSGHKSEQGQVEKDLRSLNGKTKVCGLGRILGASSDRS